MSDKRCSICLNPGLSEDAPVLTISGYGVPRCLCDDCAEKVDTVTKGRDTAAIYECISSLADTVAEKSAEDKIVFDTVSDLLDYAGDRAKKIEDGTWDFSLDEVSETVEELPEELLESEEDRLLDEQEAEMNKKLDKVLNWVYPIVFGIAVVLVVYFMLF